MKISWKQMDLVTKSFSTHFVNAEIGDYAKEMHNFY